MHGAVWSPDGRAVAYSSKVNGTYQTFLRYLNSPVSVQLTHEQQTVWPIGWSSDRSHIIVAEHADGEWFLYKIYSLPTDGGEPEFIMSAGCIACDLSRNGKVFATFTRGER
jgi:Tol biopolymer transport system component